MTEFCQALARHTLFIELGAELRCAVARRSRHDFARQQLFLREQASVFQRLAIRKIAQGFEPELQQKLLGRDLGVGRAALWRALT